MQEYAEKEKTYINEIDTLKDEIDILESKLK